MRIRDRWMLWRIEHLIGRWPVTVARFNRKHGYEWNGTEWVSKAKTDD